LQPASVTFSSLREAGVRTVLSTLFVRKQEAEAGRMPAVRAGYYFDTPDEAFAAAMRQVEMHRAWERDGLIELPPPPAENQKSKIKNLPPSPYPSRFR
jgi:hypothetical protein